MALRGVQPDLINKRLKAFFYGDAKVGKTTAAIQFPAPYLIDTEKGAENNKYIELIKQQNGAVFQCFDFDDLLKEVKALMTEKHPYKTLIIDPITGIYDLLVEQCANNPKIGTGHGRHYGEANKRMKVLMNMLVRIDMNVIVTAHSKNEYGDNMAVLGKTFDGYKKLDYVFDLIIEAQKKGKQRMAYVKGTRLSGFEEGDSFEFKYENIAQRYGREAMEKDSSAFALATDTQLTELHKLIATLKITEEVTDKWLNKAQVFAFDEMSAIDIQKCIDYLKQQAAKPRAA